MTVHRVPSCLLVLCTIPPTQSKRGLDMLYVRSKSNPHQPSIGSVCTDQGLILNCISVSQLLSVIGQLNDAKMSHDESWGTADSQPITWCLLWAHVVLRFIPWSPDSFIWPGLVFHFLPQDTTPVESTLFPVTLGYPFITFILSVTGLQRPV